MARIFLAIFLLRFICLGVPLDGRKLLGKEEIKDNYFPMFKGNLDLSAPPKDTLVPHGEMFDVDKGNDGGVSESVPSPGAGHLERGLQSVPSPGVGHLERGLHSVLNSSTGYKYTTVNNNI